MDGRILSQRGVSLLEAGAVLIIMGFVLSILIPNNVQRIQNAQFQKTVTEMTSIARAAIDFYTSQGVCPTGIGQLAPTFIPQAVTLSPFNSTYLLSCANNMVSVSDLIPAGLAQKNPQGPLLQVMASGAQDNITITQRISYAFIGRVLYETKYLY